MLERLLSVAVITAIGAITGLFLGGVAYGLGYFIGKDFGVGSIFIVSAGAALAFIVDAVIKEFNRWRRM